MGKLALCLGALGLAWGREVAAGRSHGGGHEISHGKATKKGVKPEPRFVYEEQGDWELPNRSCERGYALEEGFCVKREAADPELLCEEGRLVGNKCVDVVQEAALLTCPAGYTLKKHRCWKEYRFDPDFQCPRGFERRAEECVSSKRYKAEETCQKGERLIGGGMCERITRYDARATCPTGAELSYNHGVKCLAESFFEPELKCHRHKGELVGDSCVQTRKQSPSPRCAGHGMHLHNTKSGTLCRFVDKVEGMFECPVGEVDGGACRIIEERPVERLCNDGFTHHKGRCLKIDVIDKVRYRCPHHFSLDTSVDGIPICLRDFRREPHLQCPSGTSPHSKHKSLCIRHAASTTPLVGCPEGFVNLGGKKCIREIRETPDFSCPHGTEETIGPSGLTSCIGRIKNKKSKNFKCPAGTLMRGRKSKCVVEEDIEGEPECPKGAILGDDNTCALVQYATKELSCPKGYFLEGGKCVRNKKYQPTYSCANNAVLTKKNQCLAELFYTPKPNCPHDAFFDADRGLCIARNVVSQELYCPQNHVLHHGTCLSGHKTKRGH